MVQVGLKKTLFDIRKSKGLNQKDLADLLGLVLTTYAYKEQNGTFTEDQQRKIAKYLKQDMTAINWKPFKTGNDDHKDKLIKEQQETIIKLQAQIEMLMRLMEKEKS